MSEEDLFDGIDIPKEAKVKLENKLIELNYRMNSMHGKSLTNENRREFILFSLALINGVPNFLRKLCEAERKFVTLHITRKNGDTFNNNSSNNYIEEKNANDYEIVYDNPPPELRSILKKSKFLKKSRRKKHKKSKKVRFNIPDDEHANNNETNETNDNNLNEQQADNNNNDNKPISNETQTKNEKSTDLKKTSLLSKFEWRKKKKMKHGKNVNRVILYQKTKKKK